MTSRQNAAVRALVERWIEECIIGLSLCPYARVPYEKNRVRMVVCESPSGNAVLQFLQDEAAVLQQSKAETSLIVCTQAFDDFLEFNDFLDSVEQRLQETGDDQKFQLVSFHPGYLFAGEAADDASHYTNRAPFPILQLLRVDSVSNAVDSTDTLAIPLRNIKTLRAMKRSDLEQLFVWCGQSSRDN